MPLCVGRRMVTEPAEFVPAYRGPPETVRGVYSRRS